MSNQIWDPINNKFVNLLTENGNDILQTYLQQFLNIQKYINYNINYKNILTTTQNV